MSESKPDYHAHRTDASIKIDGDLTKGVWQKAVKSHRFLDMATGDPRYFSTQMACTWNDDYLYVGFWIEEPFVEARLTKRAGLHRVSYGTHVKYEICNGLSSLRH